MYTEEYESRGTPIKDLVIRAILALIIIVTAFITVKVMTKDEYVNNANINTNPYTSSTYKENIEHINTVALGYFDEDKLKEIKKDEPYKVTIKELIDEGILVSIIDKNDKVCDSKNSYIELTPFEDDEYVLKTNLKCKTEDNYVLTHLGHYNYCSDYLCEKEGITLSTKATTSTKVVKISDTNKINDEITVEPKEEVPYIPAQDDTKDYEYATTKNAKLGSWSDWSGWTKTSCDTKGENCDDKDPTCRRKIVLYNREEQISSYSNKYNSNRKALSQTTTSNIKGCQEYNYVVINNVVYATNAVYTMVNSISSDTKSTQGNWEYKGEQSFDTPPSDTVNKVYKFIKIDFEACEETCVDKPLKYVYDVYEFTGELKNVNDDASLLCQGSMSKTVAVYTLNDTSDTGSRKEPVYGNVCYYNMKTRKVNSKGNTKKQFSVFGDTTLLSQNYYYTGTVKQKG